MLDVLLIELNSTLWLEALLTLLTDELGVRLLSEETVEVLLWLEAVTLSLTLLLLDTS